MAPLIAIPAPRPAPVLASAADARLIFGGALARLAVEQLGIAFLDPDRRLIALGHVHGGERAAVALPIRPILVHALSLRATGLVLAHNHPTGDPEPSVADIAATRTLARAAGGVGIRLIDHLIVAGEQCRSFRQAGLL